MGGSHHRSPTTQHERSDERRKKRWTLFSSRFLLLGPRASSVYAILVLFSRGAHPPSFVNGNDSDDHFCRSAKDLVPEERLCHQLAIKHVRCSHSPTRWKKFKTLLSDPLLDLLLLVILRQQHPKRPRICQKSNAKFFQRTCGTLHPAQHDQVMTRSQF